MLRLFWIGHDYFQTSLPLCGFEVRYFNFNEFEVFNWERIVEIAGYEPDVLVVADKSLPPFVLGMENFPCLTVFYAVDSHIHSWFANYAQAFDLCLVSLHDHVDFFRHKNLASERILWSPPFARDTDAPNDQISPEHDCLFVGNVNAENLAKRVKFIEELKEYMPSLHVLQGNYAKLFPLGRVLLNHCENEDLNFRVFEALGCGGVLVTPQVGHGLDKLFINKKHLVTYESGNAKDAAKCIEYLLANANVRQSLAQQGLMEIDKKHRALHRAQALSNLIHSIPRQEIINARLQNAPSVRKVWLRQIYLLFADVMQKEELREIYLKAALGV